MNETPRPPIPEPRPPWTPWLIMDTVQGVLLLALSYGAESRSGAFAVLALAMGYGGVKWHAFSRGTATERRRLLVSAGIFTLFALGLVVGTFLRLAPPA